MNTKTLGHNPHRQDPKRFLEYDHHLSQLKKMRYIYKPAFLQNLPHDAGFFTLTGGCMTGKTTLIKQWMAALLSEGIPSQNIALFCCELIENSQALKNLLQKQLDNTNTESMQYIFLDDATDIHHWEKAITFAKDAGWLKNTLIVIVSADRDIIKTQASCFPDSREMHFHLYPLTFQQCVSLKNSAIEIKNINLLAEFEQYLIHGGFLPAINDMAVQGFISDQTLENYSNKLCKEMHRQGRRDEFLREILTAIVTQYSRPVTWNMICQEISINHPKTIGDYLALLESLDAVFVQYALLEDSLKLAPKKARKLIFCDPFIFHAINAWLHPGKDHFSTLITPVLAGNALTTKIVQACVSSHYRLHYPTYYIKDEGEINLAYIHDHRFWPILVTWTNQLHAKNLKQLLKYSNGKILTQAMRSGVIEHIRTEPIAQALYKLGIYKCLSDDFAVN